MSIPSLASVYARAGLSIFKSATLPAGSVSPLSLSCSVPEIDRAKSDAFSRMVGSRGVPKNFIPSTYLQAHTMAMPMSLLADLPIRIIGSLHEATEIQFNRYCEFGEKLKATASFDGDIRFSDKEDVMLEVKLDIFGEADAGDKPIQTVVNQYRILNPRRHLIQTEKKEKPSSENDFPDWTTENYHFPIDIGRRYALLNGDINPIHITSVSAKFFGYKSCISHGMFSVCKMFGQVEDTGTNYVKGKFVRPILLPQDVVGRRDAEGNYVVGYVDKGDFKVCVEGEMRC